MQPQISEDLSRGEEGNKAAADLRRRGEGAAEDLPSTIDCGAKLVWGFDLRTNKLKYHKKEIKIHSRTLA